MLRIFAAFLLFDLFATAASAKGIACPKMAKARATSVPTGGGIEILYGGGDAVVTVGDTVAQMRRDPDAAHELYAGGGWLWSVTGRRSGELARSAAPNGVSCQVG